MPEYRVAWEIDISADSPRKAAEQAEHYQKNGHYRGAFDVYDEENNKTYIDLEENDE